MKKILQFLRFKIWILPLILVFLYFIILGSTSVFGDTNFLNWCGTSVLVLLLAFGVIGGIYGIVMWIKEK